MILIMSWPIHLMWSNVWELYSRWQANVSNKVFILFTHRDNGNRSHLIHQKLRSNGIRWIYFRAIYIHRTLNTSIHAFERRQTCIIQSNHLWWLVYRGRERRGYCSILWPFYRNKPTSWEVIVAVYTSRESRILVRSGSMWNWNTGLYWIRFYVLIVL